jgi:hypothetical protein
MIYNAAQPSYGTHNFQIAGTERMRITNAGNVGIGTAAPDTYVNSMGTTLVVGTGNNWAVIQGRTDGPSGSTNGVNYGGSYGTNPINGARMFIGAAGGAGQRGLITFNTKNLDDATSQPLERMRIAEDGVVSMTGITNLATAGAYFGTAAAANLLDDYEEGTWTPAFTFATVGDLGTVTYVAQTGQYTKIGNMVIASFYCYVSTGMTWSSASGDFHITGLPFTIGSQFSAGALDIQGVATGRDGMASVAENGLTYLKILGSSSGGSRVTATAAHLTSGAAVFIRGSISYRV